MRVVYFHRKPAPGLHFSLESYFRGVRSMLPSSVQCAVATSSFASEGILRRASNILEAAGRPGDINHITGDIHYVGLALPKARTILTIHDCVSLTRTQGLRRHLLRSLWYSLPMRRVAAVTVVSESTKSVLLNEVDCDPDLIRVIPVFIAPEFLPSRKPFAPVPRILQVRTGENKNLLRLAEALTGIPCHLDIIGQLSPSQREALSRFNISHETSFNLSDAQVRAKYAAADIVAFVSTHEGFGMPILEANSVGRPVVCGNTTSMPEVAGKAACLVNPYDVGDIRAGFVRVIGSSTYRAQLVEEGFRNVRRFNPERIAAAYLELYRDVAGERPLKSQPSHATHAARATRQRPRAPMPETNPFPPGSP